MYQAEGFLPTVVTSSLRSKKEGSSVLALSVKAQPMSMYYDVIVEA